MSTYHYKKTRVGLDVSIAIRFYLTYHPNIEFASDSGYVFMDIGDGVNPGVELSLFNSSTSPGLPALQLRTFNGVDSLVEYEYSMLSPGFANYVELYARRSAPAHLVLYVRDYENISYETEEISYACSNFNEIRFGNIRKLGTADSPIEPIYVRSVAGLDNPASYLNRIGPHDSRPDPPLVEHEDKYGVAGCLADDRLYFQVDNPAVFYGRNVLEPVVDTQAIFASPIQFNFKHRAPVTTQNRVVFAGLAENDTQTAFVVMDTVTGTPPSVIPLPIA